MIKNLIFRSVQNINWMNAISRSETSDEYLVLDDNKITGNILFVIPHADDELISSYHLLEIIKNRAFIYYCGMTGSNDNPKNKALRDSEIKDLCEKKHFQLLNPSDWRKSFIDAISEYRIKTIFMPSFIDWHPEHRAISDFIIDIAESIPRDIDYYMYSVSVPIINRKTFMVPMNKKEQIEKYRMFSSVYKSQKNMPIERFKIQERINAKETNYFAAEVFIKVSIEDIGKCRTVSSEELNHLSERINNIIKIREDSKRLYYSIIDENSN